MQVVDGTILVALGQRRCTVIEILRETPSFRARRKGGGPCGATAEPSGGVEAPAFRPGRTSTPPGVHNGDGGRQLLARLSPHRSQVARLLGDVGNPSRGKDACESSDSRRYTP